MTTRAKAPSLSLTMPSTQVLSPTLSSIAQEAASSFATIQPVVTKPKTATPTVISTAPITGGNMVRVDPNALSSIAQEAARQMNGMVAKPSSSITSVTPYSSSGTSVAAPANHPNTVVPFSDGGSTPVPSDGPIPGLGNTSTTDTSSGGGGGGIADAQPDAQPYYDDSGSYADPTWDSATTAVPATTAVLVASTPKPTTLSVSATPTIVPAKTIWQRLWSFLGFGSSSSATAAVPALPPAQSIAHGESSLEDECTAIVRRSRLGDQNATALIVRVRENAEKGNAKAKKSYAIMMAYTEKHPVSDSVEVAGDLDIDIVHNDAKIHIHHTCECDPLLGTAVSLSRGETLSNPRIEQYMSQFGGEMQRAMMHGILNPRRIPKDNVNPDLAKAHAVGRAIGTARRLQAVRTQNSSMTALDPVIGWECGE